MKAQLLGLSAISLLFLAGGMCCGVGIPGLYARDDVGYRCTGFDDCPFAVGAAVTIAAYPDEEIREVSIDDPSLANLEISEGDVIVRPTAAGRVTLTATLEDDIVLPTTLVFAERATTRVTAVTDITLNSYSGPPQVFAGAAFDVIADHRDAADRPLRGSGLENWSITGGSFAAPPHDAVRRVVAGSDPKLIVGARPDGTPLEVDVLPPGSTARIELERSNYGSVGEIDTLAMRDEAVTWFSVSAFAANGRFIYGVPAGGELTMTTDNATVATAHSVSGSAMRIDVIARAPGSTVLTIAFDGITRSFRIDVY